MGYLDFLKNAVTKVGSGIKNAATGISDGIKNVANGISNAAGKINDLTGSNSSENSSSGGTVTSKPANTVTTPQGGTLTGQAPPVTNTPAEGGVSSGGGITPGVPAETPAGTQSQGYQPSSSPEYSSPSYNAQATPTYGATDAPTYSGALYGTQSPTYSEASYTAPESSFKETPELDSFEEYLKKQGEGYEGIRDDTVGFYNTQEQSANQFLDKQYQDIVGEGGYAETAKNNADAYYNTQYQNVAGEGGYASHIKELTDGTVNSQYDAASSYATGTKENADKYVNSQYDSGVGYADYLKGVTDKSVSEQATAARDYAQSELDALLRNDTENPENNGYLIKENAAAKEYANTSYDTYKDYLEKQYGLDSTQVSNDLKHITDMSETQLKDLVAAAERQREEAAKTAEVSRQRGVVDAKSAYEQNKSTYGANAEAMANMGLEGGGYAAYLNERAYGTQRAEVQAANAQAAAANREAQYTYDQAELSANATHNQNVLEAESNYKNRLYALDSAYNQNLKSAEQTRDNAIYEADSALRQGEYSANSAYRDALYNANAAEREGLANSKLTYAQMLQEAAEARDAGLYQSQENYNANMFNTESDKREGLANSELAYTQMLQEAAAARDAGLYQSQEDYNKTVFDANSALEAGKFEASQNAEAGRFGAEMGYKENMLQNDANIAGHRYDTEEARKGAYAEILAGANSGAYTEEEAVRLAEKYGLSADEAALIGKAAKEYKTEENKQNYLAALENVSTNYTYLEPEYVNEMASLGYITPAQATKLIGDMEAKAEKYWNSLSDEDKAKTTMPPALEQKILNTDVNTPYYQGKINSDAVKYGTFDNGYQPKGINGHGSLKKSGEKHTFETTVKYGEDAGKKKTVTQTVWQAEDGTKWYWEGRENKYIKVPETPKTTVLPSEDIYNTYSIPHGWVAGS